MIGFVAVIVGLLVRDLERHREATATALAETRRTELWRSRLVSLLAHDVRAPLAGAQLGLRTIRDNVEHLTAAQVVELANAGIRQSERALLLARDLLDMAQSEAGTLRLDTAPVRALDLVDRVTELSAARAALTVVVDERLVVLADAARMEQVLHNLVDNAVRHGAPPVELTAREVDGWGEIVVRDHGPGIPDGVELFAAFSGSERDSVGLGMWATKVLVEAHGGTITHADAAPGTVFTVRLPLGTARLDAPEHATSIEPSVVRP